MDEGKFYSLKEEVIDPGLCVRCGACSAFCNRIELDIELGFPTLVGPCVMECSHCYDICPIRKDFDSNQVFGKTKRDPILGPYIEIKSVRASKEGMRKDAQDGGAVTAILSAILDRGKIDAAVVVEKDENWEPLPRIITSIEELLESKGSKYSPSPNAESLGRVFRTMAVKSVALVDVGCHIRGLRNMEFNLLYNAGFSPYSDLKIYTIGLFCSGSFERNMLFETMKKDPNTIKKMDISKGKLTVNAERVESWPVKNFEGAFMPSCRLCSDYTAELADLSVGSVGSPEGYSTVIVRNLMGWGMLRDAVQRGYVEADESLVDIDALKKSVTRKIEKVRAEISEKKRRGQPLPGFIQS